MKFNCRYDYGNNWEGFIRDVREGLLPQPVMSDEAAIKTSENEYEHYTYFFAYKSRKLIVRRGERKITLPKNSAVIEMRVLDNGAVRLVVFANPKISGEENLRRALSDFIKNLACRVWDIAKEL